jgi:hypothetical protein
MKIYDHKLVGESNIWRSFIYESINTIEYAKFSPVPVYGYDVIDHHLDWLYNKKFNHKAIVVMKYSAGSKGHNYADTECIYLYNRPELCIGQLARLNYNMFDSPTKYGTAQTRYPSKHKVLKIKLGFISNSRIEI